MKLTAKDLKAIAWFIKDKNLKPQLSTPPRMYFKEAEGTEVTYELAGIITEWSAWNEEDKKQRAREKRVADTRRAIKRGW